MSDHEIEEQAQEWREYIIARENWVNTYNSLPGAFSRASSDLFWCLSCSVPMPTRDKWPTIILPLRIHLSRGIEFGCSLTKNDCIDYILPMLNGYWSQASIVWELIAVLDKSWSVEVEDTTPGSIRLSTLRDNVWSLQRDPSTGMMADKEFRRSLFLDHLLKGHEKDVNTYDLYMFDFIGQQSQGCCISRETRTLIMGNRSTKGYPEPTARPLPCLAKTMAHELGHALGLDHPKGRKFADGTSCTLAYGSDNLMVGGADRSGGGGSKLEEWQILLSRSGAERFLSNQGHSRTATSSSI